MNERRALTVEPLTPERWDDFALLFGPNGACAGCWCMWWRLRRKDFENNGNTGNKVAFRRRVRAGPPPGLLAYDGALAVGWCQVTPRAELTTLGRSRLLQPVDAAPVWSLSCFFVKAGHRRRGVTGRLIAAAKIYAHSAGAGILEAYPWDTAEKKAGSTLYTGLATSFARAGFAVVARRAPHRPIMRCPLDAA